MQSMAFMKFVLILIILSSLNFSIIFATKIDCGSPNITKIEFPVAKEKAKLGTNYEVTIRSTNWLKGNETAKYVEQNFDGTRIVRKWQRKMETVWYNRSVLFEDHYRMPDAHHLGHNRSCNMLPNSTTATNPFGLSPQFLQSLGIEEATFGQLLAKIAGMPEYNGTYYEVDERMMGVEVVGWLGCIQNVSGRGQNLQLNVRFAGDHTSQEPYNPYWNNPLVYAVDLVLYDLFPNWTVNTVFDELSLDVAALDRVHLADKEFSVTPPSGVYCQGMPPTSLPVQFPAQFLAQISTTRMEANKPKTSQNIYFYDGQSRIVAYSPEIFQQPKSTGQMDEGKKLPTIRHVIHDFTYGFQYTIASNGTCQSVGPIPANSPDVTALPDGQKGENEEDDPAEVLFMLHPEETLIWHGRRQRMAKNAFYYAGKVKSSDSGEPLAVYSTTRPAQRQKWTERDSTANSTQELVEIRLSFSPNGGTEKFHSILAFNSTNEGDRLETQRIFMEEENVKMNNQMGMGWRTLHAQIRPCIKLGDEDVTMEANLAAGKRGNASDFYVQLANATLSQLDQAIGRPEAMGAIAHALALGSNISQLRIVDLELKEIEVEIGDGGGKKKGNILVALFSIGRPVMGVKPAKTAYLKEEIGVEEAAAALNATIRAHQFQIRIPLEQAKKDWNITGTEFGTQSSLYPSPWPPAPIPPPSPQPSPPSFVGYSGSALTICSIFAFILGAGLCIGGYIFYQKRQHIRGIAYQVFE